MPVAAKEMQNQSAQWARLKSERSDFVLLWGWSKMNAGAVYGGFQIIAIQIGIHN